MDSETNLTSNKVQDIDWDILFSFEDISELPRSYVLKLRDIIEDIETAMEEVNYSEDLSDLSTEISLGYQEASIGSLLSMSSLYSPDQGSSSVRREPSFQDFNNVIIEDEFFFI